MDRAKHPELAKEYDELSESKAKILADLAPHEAEAAKLRATADAAEDAWKKKRTMIAGVEQQRGLAKITGRLAALARAMGAISMKAAGR